MTSLLLRRSCADGLARAAATIAGLTLLTSDSRLAAQQGTVFSARVDSVRVDALVTDGRQPIAGLRATDFEILDNGVPQAVALVDADEMPVNVILGLDMSGSVAGEKLRQLRLAGLALLDGLQPADKSALIVFSWAVTISSPLSSDAGAVRRGLDEASIAGNTSLIDATFTALQVAGSDLGRSVVMLFSDGADTASFLSIPTVVGAARRSDAVIYAVATSGSGGGRFLDQVSEITGGRLLAVDAPAKLGPAFVSILNEFRHRYLLSFVPTGVSGTGWHKLEVRVKGRRATVNARAGYQR